MPPKYADLADLPEDSRIDQIGRAAMSGKKVAFCVDAERTATGYVWGKADRYQEKLLKKFPGIVIITRFRGPVAGTVTVKVGPPGSKHE